ncbi:hypothetical protein Tcan_06147 [Toxocara canis]|uniref:Uncharacterized protein n=1 Tax=Toxocara canis TaxID=6265 RepID=A0A0B2V6L1_TOXCA|nr:hypothetical protein Tcan_06147 [Toxocara canis]
MKNKTKYFKETVACPFEDRLAFAAFSRRQSQLTVTMERPQCIVPYKPRLQQVLNRMMSKSNERSGFSDRLGQFTYRTLLYIAMNCI